MPRISQLDSLRGFMALIVVFHHIYLSLPDYLVSGWGKVIKLTPLRIFVAGHSSVLVFFVMSGFVLTLPLIKGRPLDVPTFLLKRFLRLYPPLAASIFIAAVAFALAGPEPVETASNWINENWKMELTPSVLIGHLFVIGRDQDINLNSPLWSLIFELRIGAVFPILIIAVARLRNWALLLSGILLEAMNIILPLTGDEQVIYISSHTVLGSLLITVRYASFFIAGMAMAFSIDRWTSFLGSLSRLKRLALLAVCLMLFAFPSTSAHFSDWFIGIGAVGLVALTIKFGDKFKMMQWPPMIWLGRVSCSLYLIHLPLLLFILHSFSDQIGFGNSLIIFCVVLLPASELMYLAVELPSIKFGKKLSEKLYSRHERLSA